MSHSATKGIKREQKKALYLRHLAELLRSLSETELAVREVYITRVDFSNDTGICYVYFAAYNSREREQAFKAALEVLKLYKASLRQALAKMIHSRYVPNLVFLYDAAREKQMRVEELISKVQEDLERTEDLGERETEDA